MMQEVMERWIRTEKYFSFYVLKAEKYGDLNGKEKSSLFSRVISNLCDQYHDIGNSPVTSREVFFHFVIEVDLGFANVP